MKDKIHQSAPNEPPKAEAHGKSHKKKHGQKVARHHFVLSESEYSLIATLKNKLNAAGVDVKKRDLIRAGIKTLSALSISNLNKKLSKLYLNI